MKNKLAIAGFALLLAIAIFSFAFIPTQGNKDKKEQQGQGKGNQGKGNQGKVNQGQGNQDNKGTQGKGNQGQGNQDDKGNQGKGKGIKPGVDISDVDVNDNNGKGKKVKVGDDGNIIWDRESFKDRKNHRKGEKVTICHKFNRDGDPGVTINVSSNAMKAHMGHGDVMGACPTNSDRRFSDIFTKRRGDYYTTIVNGQEQVYYSQSILDYALSRLSESRLELDQYRRSGMPADQIRQREVAIVELEQNTSLLEKLVTAAAVLVADRL
jgi:hypothetical protein